MSTKLAVSAALLAVLLACLLLFSFFGPPGDPFARFVAISSLGIALSKLGWDCHVYLEAKKEREEAKKEKVRIEDPEILHQREGYFIRFKVLNQSAFSISITGVDLNVRRRSTPCDITTAYSLRPSGILAWFVPVPAYLSYIMCLPQGRLADHFGANTPSQGF